MPANNPRRRAVRCGPARPMRWIMAGLLLASGALIAQQQAYYFSSSDQSYGTFYNYDTVEQSAWDQEKADSERKRDERLARKSEERDRERADRAAQDEAERQRREATAHEMRATPGSGAPIVLGYNNPTADSLLDSYASAQQQAAKTAAATAAMPPKGKAPAAGLTAVGVGGTTYYYGEGQFYILEGETRKPVSAPEGAMVFSIPDDHTAHTVNGETIFEYKGAFYQRVMFSGRVLFEVVPKPAEG